MSLISCAECNKEISSKATYFPLCECARPKRLQKLTYGLFITIFSLFVILLQGCGRSDLSTEKSTVVAKEAVKIQESMPYHETPEGYLSVSIHHIEKGSFAFPKEHLNKLITQFPDSPEAATAKELLSQLDVKKKEFEEKKLVKQKEEEEKRQLQIKSAVKNLQKRHDEVTGVTWYQPKNLPNLATHLKAYIGTKEGAAVTLRKYIMYYGDDWLFVSNYILVIDGKKYEYTPSDFLRDNSGGSVWEWSDEYVDEEGYKVLREIAASKKTIMRLSGTQYHKDHIITANEKARLTQVLDAYDALK